MQFWIAIGICFKRNWYSGLRHIYQFNNAWILNNYVFNCIYIWCFLMQNPATIPTAFGICCKIRLVSGFTHGNMIRLIIPRCPKGNIWGIKAVGIVQVAICAIIVIALHKPIIVKRPTVRNLLRRQHRLHQGIHGVVQSILDIIAEIEALLDLVESLSHVDNGIDLIPNLLGVSLGDCGGVRQRRHCFQERLDRRGDSVGRFGVLGSLFGVRSVSFFFRTRSTSFLLGIRRRQIPRLLLAVRIKCSLPVHRGHVRRVVRAALLGWLAGHIARVRLGGILIGRVLDMDVVMIRLTAFRSKRGSRDHAQAHRENKKQGKAASAQGLVNLHEFILPFFARLCFGCKGIRQPGWHVVVIEGMNLQITSRGRFSPLHTTGSRQLH